MNIFQIILPEILQKKLSDLPTSCQAIMEIICLNFVVAVIGAFIVLAMMWLTKPFFALLLFIWLCIHLSIVFIFFEYSNRSWEIHSDAVSVLSGKIVDVFTNILNVRLFARGPYESNYLNEFQQDEIIKAKKAMWIVEWMRIGLGLNGLALVFGMLALLLHGWSHGWVTLGDFTQIKKQNQYDSFAKNANKQTLQNKFSAYVEDIKQRMDELKKAEEQASNIKIDSIDVKDGDEIIISNEQYNSELTPPNKATLLQNHFSELEDAVNRLFEAKNFDELEDAKIALKEVHRSLKKDPALKQEGHNPLADTIAEDIVNAIGKCVNVVAQWFNTSNDLNLEKNIAAFFTFKTKNEKLVENLGQLLNEVEATPTKSPVSLAAGG